MLIDGKSLESVEAVYISEYLCKVETRTSTQILCITSPGAIRPNSYLHARTTPELSSDQKPRVSHSWKYDGRQFSFSPRILLLNFYIDPIISGLVVPPDANLTTQGGGILYVSGENFGEWPDLVSARLTGANASCVCLSVTHTQIHLRLPEGAGSNRISVRIASSDWVSSPDTFSYNAPSITSLSPTVAPTLGQQQIFIFGTEFGPPGSIPAVQIGSSFGCTVTAHTFTSITCNASAGYGQDLTVVVRVGGQSDISSPLQLFSYETPLLEALSVPSSELATTGGFRVQLRGRNLHPFSDILFNGALIHPDEVDSDLHEV